MREQMSFVQDETGERQAALLACRVREQPVKQRMQTADTLHMHCAQVRRDMPERPVEGG